MAERFARFHRFVSDLLGYPILVEQVGRLSTIHHYQDLAAKYNSADVHMIPALQTGKLEIQHDSVVRRILVEGGGTLAIFRGTYTIQSTKGFCSQSRVFIDSFEKIPAQSGSHKVAAAVNNLPVTSQSRNRPNSLGKFKTRLLVKPAALEKRPHLMSRVAAMSGSAPFHIPRPNPRSSIIPLSVSRRFCPSASKASNSCWFCVSILLLRASLREWPRWNQWAKTSWQFWSSTIKLKSFSAQISKGSRLAAQ